MKNQELMTRPVRTCAPQDSLETAARLLWENDCGVLPVVDCERRVVATITDRDICMGAYTHGKRLADLRVADSMSKTIVSCRADEDFTVAARKMAEHEIRRLPVVDGDGRICGIVSLSDLARVADKDKDAAREALKVLTVVSRPRKKAVATVGSRAMPTVLVATGGSRPPANAARAAVLGSSKIDSEC